ncbi:hypothetical protein PX699_14880 [Sphingobium sp. H39-3-25]|uniref:hypothetical protein n=1 Tax=Sphingobium arseniciresistens TaxID=3030834 RepID=UPI0023B9711A|nr:hypothetical protein [Sphingobium arseniciresistens]
MHEGQYARCPLFLKCPIVRLRRAKRDGVDKVIANGHAVIGQRLIIIGGDHGGMAQMREPGRGVPGTMTWRSRACMAIRAATRLAAPDADLAIVDLPEAQVH